MLPEPTVSSGFPPSLINLRSPSISTDTLLVLSFGLPEPAIDLNSKALSFMETDSSPSTKVEDVSNSAEPLLRVMIFTVPASNLSPAV